MDKIYFKKSFDEQGLITQLDIGGTLVLENSGQLKKELVEILDFVGEKLNINIQNRLEIDISCIQLLLGFIRYLDDHHVEYQLGWSLNDEQRALLENVGFSTELFLN